MTQVITHIGGVIGAVIAAVLTNIFAPGLSGLPFWVIHAGAFSVGVVVWFYSPLPDSNDLAGDRGRYWGWSRPREVTKEEST
jgi:hypothetical protein